MIAALLPLLIAGMAPQAAPRIQDTRALDAAVRAFTGQDIASEGGARAAVDSRLRLAACALPDLSWRTPVEDAVVIRCDAPAWRIFVPVRRATPVARPAPAAGTVAVAAPPPVRAEPVIRRGDPVTLEASSGGFAVSRDGVAMGDAAPGARFMVRVDPARPPVQAVAIESGRATLPAYAK